MSEAVTPAHTNIQASPSTTAVLVSAVLGGSAGGAGWCFLALWLPWPAQFWIVPIAIALAAFARWQGYRSRAAIACTALATGIAFVYAQYLFGAVRIADAMGLSLREALFKAGFSLTFDIAWANLRAWDWGALVVALAMGTITTMIRSRPARLSGS